MAGVPVDSEAYSISVELLAAGLHPDEAAQQAIDLLGERVQGEGGCIVLDKEGQFGWAHNSSDMPCAAMTSAMDGPQLWLNKPEASPARTAFPDQPAWRR